MDNGDDLSNVFLVKMGDDKIDKDPQLSQFEKDDMCRVCQVHREGMCHQNSRKMDKALKDAELIKLTSERHYNKKP